VSTAPIPVVAQVIAAYSAGLDAELELLHQLDALAAHQRDATATNDLEGLSRGADARSRLLSALVTIEFDLRPLRARLADARHEATALPGFPALVAKHREAMQLTARIIGTDQATLAALREAEVARRFAAQAIEAGETTLAAYRRVVAPPPSSAAIFDERG
jgi:hypothetical protein